MSTIRVLPRPSRNPTHKLSTQCDYHPSNSAETRKRALIHCLDNHTFDYKALVGRLNLIRNYQSADMKKYRDIYTTDLQNLKAYVKKVRKQTHDSRTFMLKANDQRRHVELLLEVPLNTEHPTPQSVLQAYRERVVDKNSNKRMSTKSNTRYNICKEPVKYTTYPYHMYVRGSKANIHRATVRKNSNLTNKTSRTCTLHLYFELSKNASENRLRQMVRDRVLPWGNTRRVRVLKYPSGAFAPTPA